MFGSLWDLSKRPHGAYRWMMCRFVQFRAVPFVCLCSCLFMDTVGAVIMQTINAVVLALKLV